MYSSSQIRSKYCTKCKISIIPSLPKLHVIYIHKILELKGALEISELNSLIWQIKSIPAQAN